MPSPHRSSYRLIAMWGMAVFSGIVSGAGGRPALAGSPAYRRVIGVSPCIGGGTLRRLRGGAGRDGHAAVQRRGGSGGSFRGLATVGFDGFGRLPIKRGLSC